MLAKRIIPCLDVLNDKVVKGIKFNSHRIVGDILELASYYCEAGADELVFYDITASCDKRILDKNWVRRIARFLNIPFCVAGGIRSIEDAETLLNAGADKISINSPALENPKLISELSKKFGKQCVVIGIDSLKTAEGYQVCQYTGNVNKLIYTKKSTVEWIQEVEERGAGEIVLNCMNKDGTRSGYDIEQLHVMRSFTSIPLIASGGAGQLEDFLNVFRNTEVDGALAASVFHDYSITISALKSFLVDKKIEVRI